MSKIHIDSLKAVLHFYVQAQQKIEKDLRYTFDSAHLANLKDVLEKLNKGEELEIIYN